MNAIIIGASSGIGRALAKQLAEHGYVVGLMARRRALLESLQQEITTKTFIKEIDISKSDEAMQRLSELIVEMGKIDLIVINAGVGFLNDKLDWLPERDTIDINVTGFAAMANVAIHHFEAHQQGHLVGISSIAALRGNGGAPAYNASKAFMSNYLEGLRHKYVKLRMPITITDIQPGFVDTEMAKAPNLFWVASAEKAAHQIFATITRKRRHAYVSKRWRLIAWIFKLLPDPIYDRIL